MYFLCLIQPFRKGCSRFFRPGSTQRLVFIIIRLRSSLGTITRLLLVLIAANWADQIKSLRGGHGPIDGALRFRNSWQKDQKLVVGKTEADFIFLHITD